MVMSMYLSIMARILLCSRDVFSQVIAVYLTLHNHSGSQMGNFM
jgi:hypothetical protein